MMDRGIIKWQPFNSCFNAQEVIEDINKQKEKERIKFPTLSEDQLMVLEDKIKNSFYLKLKIKIDYYYDGEIKSLIGKINYFDYENRKLYINNKEIHFKQIIKIREV